VVKYKKIKEGLHKKGGLNDPPTQPRPSDPKGQSPNKSKDTTVTVIIQNN